MLHEGRLVVLDRLDGNENGNKKDDGLALQVFFIRAKGTFDEQPQ
jgi:hypothetical protein